MSPNEHADLLRRKGEEHEAAYLDALRAQGRQVVDVIGADRWDFEGSARATIEAMKAGAEVIYQATFVVGDWRGRADFLERVEQPTALGAWGYEALDAKLARAEKPTYVLQLCFYSDAIASIQSAPARGDARPARHRRATDAASAPISPPTTGASAPAFSPRSIRRATTEPYRVEHCGLCEFRRVCEERWEQEDHLVLVAGIRREHVTRLRSAGVETLAKLAQRAGRAGSIRSPPHTFAALRDQASLQLHRRTTGDLDWHALPIEAERGFDRLPRPSTGDVVFDIEGDPFWEPARGLHFLFGLLTPGDDCELAVPCDLGARPGRRAASLRGAAWTSSRAPRPPSRHARLPLRCLRADGAQAAHGRVCDARGRGGRAAAARGLRGPARGRAAGPAGRACRATR